MIHLDRASDIALTDQIVTQLAGLVQDGQLPPGTRLPSIRKLAATLSVSAATVVGAYDRLAARGLIEARAASGYFVSARRTALPLPAVAAPAGPGLDAIALMRNMLERRPGVAHVGSGFLPESWLEDMLSARLLARVARKGAKSYARPGTPAGYAPLRQQIALQLGFAGIAAAPDQVLLTFGATHGAEILCRALLAPGDVVAVEEPGYFALFAQLRGMGVKMLAVPRTPQGPDLSVLASVCDTFRPKLLFTQTLLHNPTGSSTDAATAFHMLDLARRYDFRIVEDDVYGDLHPVANPLRLAQVDRFERVIFLGSYSKVLSPSIRVGYMVCAPALVPLFLEQKLLGVLATSEFDERLVYELLASGAYRKHIERVRERLLHNRAKVVLGLAQAGLQPTLETEGGLFVWAGLPENVDLPLLIEHAAQHGWMLTPGDAFFLRHAERPYLRFNAAASLDSKLFDYLRTTLPSFARGAGAAVPGSAAIAARAPGA